MKATSPVRMSPVRMSTAVPPIPSPPSSPSRITRLGVSGVANMFIRMRKLDAQAKIKSNCVYSTSGAPSSHPGVLEGACSKRVPMELVDNFVCVGGVNLVTLMRATRETLLDSAEKLGADALVDEEWTCTITPKQRPNGTYKAQIRYNASATRSSQPDPHRPVALSQAKGIPGLMTIVKRND